MNNYLNNNVLLINEYEKLYSDGIRIDEVIDKFRNDKFYFTAFDYGRFRVFIDGCLLLLNKEKLNKYKKDEYSYAEFFKLVENDQQLKYYLSFIRSNPMFSEVKKPCLFFSTEGKNKGAWDQVATIRLSFAHMQYGNFMSQESGLMISFMLYNKDKGVKKDEGIVFEPMLHEFVKGFFSNYSFGMPFKTCFFMKYSLKNNRKTLNSRFYEIVAKKNKNQKFDGYSSNVISELIKQFSDSKVDIVQYIYKNEAKYEIKESEIAEKINIKHYNICAKKYHFDTNDKYYYGLKTFLDFETELSNFLIHVGQLNNVLYEYSIVKNSGNYTKKQIEELCPQFEGQIRELKEDETATISFEIGFSYLKIMNFALRTEDDDYEKIDYSLIDVSKFLFNTESLKKYIDDNNIIYSAKQKYVIERVRNSLMHGNINCEVTKSGEVLVVFTDSFNKRNDVIKILLCDLKCFLNQKALYTGIPGQTDVLLMQRKE